MKKLVFMLMLSIVALCSCNRYKVIDAEDYASPPVDTVAIRNIVHEEMLTSFSDVSQVLDWKTDYLLSKEIDSTVISLDKQTLTNICRVVSYNKKRFTLDDIVSEYNLRKEVYTALNSVPQPIVNKDTTKATPPAAKEQELTHTTSSNTENNIVVDTIIDGNKALIFKTIRK